MIGQRKSHGMRQQVLELHSRGIGKQKIALTLGISKNTVKGIIRAAEAAIPDQAVSSKDWRDELNWEYVKNELSRRYVTIKQSLLSVLQEFHTTRLDGHCSPALSLAKNNEPEFGCTMNRVLGLRWTTATEYPSTTLAMGKFYLKPIYLRPSVRLVASRSGSL